MNRKWYFSSFLICLIILRLGFSVYWSVAPKKMGVTLSTTTFEKLPGWMLANQKNSLIAFQNSCRTIIRKNPEIDAGSQAINLKNKDWFPACMAALALDNKKLSRTQARNFFIHWFKPVGFKINNSDAKQNHGLFTGYYMPLLHGSLVKTSEYSVPIYGMPDNLVTINLELFDNTLKGRHLSGHVQNGKLVPFYTRKEINQGAIIKHAPVLVWIKSPIDRVYLEIQGSGMVQLPNGEQLYLGYAGENGASYTSIAGVLIKQGFLTKDSASMGAISKYLAAHPRKIDQTLNQNKSFVFFKILNDKIALGAQGIGLTPGYSLAVDRKWIPLGAPLWLTTSHPKSQPKSKALLQRLMIAQDTGGAIRGAIRGDVYWGAGDRAASIAGRMRNHGTYWILLPKQVVIQMFCNDDSCSENCCLP